MSRLNRIVLDVLKPHQPNVVEFATAIGNHAPGCRVSVTVSEVDEKTESVEIVIEGEDIGFEALAECISGMGASVHSIDAVEVRSETNSRSNTE